MKIESLTLRGFRNYENLSLEFDPGVNLILGDNAQGKTNLLEAISYLGSGRSFRAQKNAELIRFGSAFGEVEGRVFSQEREQTLRFLIFPGSRPRQIFRNGAKKKTLSEIAGVLPTVLFCPEDLMILKLGAGQRRRFGDSGLCQLRPNYDAALTEYHRILEQKSRILKDYHENPGLLEILPEYNTRLCQVGALLISYRARYYDALGKAAAVYHNQFSGGAEEFRLEYKTVSTVTDPFAPVGKLTEALLSHLESHRRAELDSGQCLTGPPQGRFYRHPVRYRSEGLRLPGSNPDGGHQSEACPAGADGKRMGRRAGAAAGRRALGAGSGTAGLCAEPDFLRTGVHHLLRGGTVYQARQDNSHPKRTIKGKLLLMNVGAAIGRLPGCQRTVSLRTSPQTGVAPSGDSLRSQSVLQSLPLRGRWLARPPQARDG